MYVCVKGGRKAGWKLGRGTASIPFSKKILKIYRAFAMCMDDRSHVEGRRSFCEGGILID